MRKALIAAVVAAALFAVGAFAASFGVESEDVASGTDAVAACASAADINFTETLHLTNNDWEISAVVVSFTEVSGTPPVTCIGRNATLVLQGNVPNETVVYEADKLVGADNDVTFVPRCTGATAADPIPTTIGCPDTTWTYLPVSEVWNAAVLIDGFAP